MHQITRTITTLEDLKALFSNEDVLMRSKRCRSILAMVYTAHIDAVLLQEISQTIQAFSSEITIVGATTTGEIDNGKTITHSTTVTLLFLDDTRVEAIALKSEHGGEEEMATTLRKGIAAINPKAVMMLTTPLTNNVNVFIQAFTKDPIGFELFGGGAGDYAHETSLLLSGDEVFSEGIVAVCFAGESLQIQKNSFVGWFPMGREMAATKVQGNKIFTIDDRPAFEIYKEYLNIQDDSNFFANAIGFPLLTDTTEDYLARVPTNVGRDGSLQFISEIKERETFALGFFHPQIIEQKFEALRSSVASFRPDAIFLFTCGCRRFALTDDVQMETQYLADLAPVSGFYTIGEFCDVDGKVSHMNLAFVAVAMKENESSHLRKAVQPRNKAMQSDKFVTSHTLVVGRLLHFINVLNKELEQQAIKDGLTNLYNRRHFDAVFRSSISGAIRQNNWLCFLIIDVDYFKRYNDHYGHQAGDKALIEVARCLQKSAKRANDYCFRLGGEEFGVLYKAESREKAFEFADNLRKSIEDLKIQHAKSEVGPFLTVSMGLGCKDAATISTDFKYYKEADDLLYQAKNAGRNQVRMNPI